MKFNESDVEVKPCPFCGNPVDLSDQDTLHPSGIYWRVTDGIKHYIGHKHRMEGDQAVWVINCPTVSWGCGVSIQADSWQECIDVWNKRV